MRRAFTLTAIAALAAACSYDWDEFAAVGDGGGGAPGAETGAPSNEGGGNPPGSDGSTEIDSSVSEDGAPPGKDGSPPNDAGADVVVDTGCTPSATCLADASACGTACGQTENTCAAACGNKMPCKNQCRADERACRAACATTCDTCTQAAGCFAPNQCDAAAATP